MSFWKISSLLVVTAGLTFTACRPQGPQVIQYGDNSGITFRSTEPDLTNWTPVGDVWCERGMSPTVGYSASANRQDCYQQMRKMAAAKGAEIIVLTDSQSGLQDCPGCVSYAGTAYRRVQNETGAPAPDEESLPEPPEPGLTDTASTVDAGTGDAGQTEQEPAKKSIKSRLETLKELKEDGLITESEYEAKRAKILDEL